MGGRLPPETSDWGISADLPGKKRQGKNGKEGKMERKRRKIVKGKVEIENGRRGWKFQNKKRTFFFFCFSLFKTTKICFGSTRMEIFYRKKAFHAGKKFRKNDFAPQKNFPITPLVALNF